MLMAYPFWHGEKKCVHVCVCVRLIVQTPVMKKKLEEKFHTKKNYKIKET